MNRYLWVITLLSAFCLFFAEGEGGISRGNGCVPRLSVLCFPFFCCLCCDSSHTMSEKSEVHTNKNPKIRSFPPKRRIPQGRPAQVPRLRSFVNPYGGIHSFLRYS
ncbi:hypothetical protein F5Y04DRAFT_192936 [Hypomontagnella monticulosa]|nr:hypothetical protein F5Y04DRAFT_192936 [Hypomontagnella monticulosa]